ncbi:MAG: bacillithiol biosynthesis cysteine-adding enzyme BshC [Bacteroidetes bacterium MedPE-SWsnd-G2]|nr:MAG: bacillithiol biosynthesis cysteine-adding enzyme BshC [Bacteroidetes bacterium MedPE-SWsnd-G2]
MPTECIPFRDTNYFSNFICDYLDEHPELKSLYNRFPKTENFKSQIEEKKATYSREQRDVLVKALHNQYKSINVSESTSKNISLLDSDKTFTITTGHQLNLFTGPLYFLYKIVSTLNLCKELKLQYPDYNFVPIYWMATEDHDFEEINFFKYKGQKIQWNSQLSGAVGDFKLDGLDDVSKVFQSVLGQGNNADYLKTLFTTAYTTQENLAQAMRYLVNELFSDYGLVIVDGHDKALKELFKPFVISELFDQTSYQNVVKTNDKITAINHGNYKIQVNPREINLFYLNENLRERIIETDGVFQVNNTDISWDKDQLLEEVNNYPERFSPNVILRPLYQEMILPNLCYIGGGGELAYWFQLKSNFESFNIPFPILLLRNSVLLISNKQDEKLSKLELCSGDLFLKQNDLVEDITKRRSDLNIDFSSQKETLVSQFKEMYEVAKKTDASFVGAVAAQERKQIKGLEHLEKRLLKAEKKKMAESLDRVKELQNNLFPNFSLQERQCNFSEFYVEYGQQLIQQLVLNLHPLKGEFLILNLDQDAQN